MVQRRRMGDSQREVALQSGVSHYQYRRWEADLEHGPTLTLDEILDHEACFIMRKRARMSLSDLAKALKITRQWASRLEHGKTKVTKLLRYWAKDSRPWRAPA